MPDKIDYDASKQRLLIGTGYVENVPPAVWRYEVSGKQVLLQWFSYRKRNRERPIIGDRRPPSPLGFIEPRPLARRIHHRADQRAKSSAGSSNSNRSKPRCWRRFAPARSSPRRNCVQQEP
ncbi:MAG: hypothetical protein H0X73_06070 [Chthoniobacterales bacterium]|nr:hypothetical protein [Chthoniobacterales bacterium]